MYYDGNSFLDDLNIAASLDAMIRDSEGKRPLPHWALLAANVLYIARTRALRLICHFRGHDLEDGSYAGPEHGFVSVTCRRCDYTHSRWLY